MAAKAVTMIRASATTARGRSAINTAGIRSLIPVPVADSHGEA
ncbi:hypothetical protein NSU_3049 [Novosphingobium pentaromativorans US6-1]|uniref:Uncharacterized protein n=1 Tax=Novosphingobium pentaromativorans US6-1 TaxID=1088721 RepID=G6EFC8_9SPHN|nr:hypothetical protein NSU_3049 [Novosphingobium pentaromativorans US6-1]